jgi:hypothetical protein
MCDAAPGYVLCCKKSSVESISFITESAAELEAGAGPAGGGSPSVLPAGRMSAKEKPHKSVSKTRKVRCRVEDCSKPMIAYLIYELT